MLERFISCPLFPAINWRMSKPRQRGLHGISSISSAAARPRKLLSTDHTKPGSQHWSLLLIRPYLGWIREIWRGPIVVKGILTGDDAKRAADKGAAAIVVSNHGGRQLDGVPASLRALPEVVAAVGGQTEVLMDGGIRRGSDIVKAI